MSHVEYCGTRTKDGCVVERIKNGTVEKLPFRLDIWNHSPTGFEWGYGGSGPAQLALALLAHALNDEERAVDLHQLFKWDVVSRLPHQSWRMTHAQVLAWVSMHDQQAADDLHAAKDQDYEIDLSAQADDLQR